VLIRWDIFCGAAVKAGGFPVLVKFFSGPMRLIWPLALVWPVGLLWPVSSVFAAPPDGQRAFPILKQIEQQKLDEEFKLLQASRQCVNAADNLHSLFECHRRERDAQWEKREKFHQRIEAVRAEYGLRPPGPPGRNRPGGPDGRPF
jgi:hypothetical protein